MEHRFEVGGTYRNRDGEYEVVEISGPRMVIRYEDGRRVETTVKLQARILKNMEAEEEVGSRARERAPAPVRKPQGGGGTRLGRLVERHVDDIFIAYAFAYLEEALEAVEKASSDVEAVVVQPYSKGHIASARKAMVHYRQLTGGQHIPILLTPQPRHQDQVFTCGSRLLDLCYDTEIERVERQVDAGKWLVWDESLYANNFLIVKTPIRELPAEAPIEVARNLLSGPSQGEPVGAVTIPAPKRLDPAFHHLLEDL